jgi:hypothetical protein
MQRLRGVSLTSLAILAFIVVSLLVYMVVTGLATVGTWLSPALVEIGKWTLGIAVLVLLPMSFFHNTRFQAAAGFLIASYILGFELWLFGFLFTYWLWGVVGVVIGVLLLGIGVIPLAIIALLLHGDWTVSLQLIAGCVIIFAIRTYALYVSAKAGRDEWERREKIITVEPTP